MKTSFTLSDQHIVSTQSEQAEILVYTSPDDDEKHQLFESFKIDPHDFESALDADEIARIEFFQHGLALIWKQPKNVSFGQQLRFKVTSVGLFLREDKLIIVNNEIVDLPFESNEFKGSCSSVDVLIKFLLHTVHHYVDHLKMIKQLTEELGSKLNDSMGNYYYLQMLALCESLIYYQNAIESNGIVLKQLRKNAENLNLPLQQIELLNDVILDNSQCARQAKIYNTVLAGLMDARGTIINNNVNALLKNLTLINIIFLPLNLIASIGGMSEFSTMTKNVDWKISYSLLIVSMAVLGWITWIILVKIVNTKQNNSLIS